MYSTSPLWVIAGLLLIFVHVHADYNAHYIDHYNNNILFRSGEPKNIF